QTPRIEELKKRMGETVEVKKINVDQHMDLANQYSIQVVPTLIIEKDGKVVRRLEGLTDAGTLEKLLKPLVE
ncbi:MAG: thioredoxin family protein, partial [Methanomicrobiales archaeon]|nr:thioredoxin family protein [Methanomicrobiales archaeon]